MKNPKLIVKPFAKNGQKNVIPENYETSMESNQATWDQGFGQITMLPVAAGGLPPKGQDFNGIFNQISENIVYLSQGGRFKFSAEYAEAIGGYPKGAILQSDDEKKEYLSLIDNNKVDFNTASDISASWKLVNTDDLLAQIASKQPKGDYATKTELNSGLAGKQPTGDYATKTEVNSKLTKDQNGADIPDKPKFIENLGLPEKFQPKGNYQPVGDYALQSEVNKKRNLDYNVFPEIVYQNKDYPDDKLWFYRSLSGGSGIARTNNNSVGYTSFRDNKTGDAAHVDELFGVGQRWVNVTASRQQGVVYTNTTNKTIFIAINELKSVKGMGDYVGFGFDVDGLTIFGGTAVNNQWMETLSVAVQPGGKYSLNADPAQVAYKSWMEFRG